MTQLHSDAALSVKVLGSGCANCRALLSNTKEALTRRGTEIEPEYITDMETVMSYGVMSMPALVVNGRVVSSGKVLKKEEIMKLLDRCL